MINWQLAVLLLAGVVGLALAQEELRHDVKCTSGTFNCRTCMGYDQINCDYGQTCCSTACFKLVDDDNNIIAKGCWDANHEPKDLKNPPTDNHRRDYNLTDVKLPSTDANGNPKTLHGLGYFCRPTDFNDESYCNVATPIVSSILLLLTTILLH